MGYESVNPYTGERMRSCPEHTGAQMAGALRRAEALAIANDSPFGLGGSICTRDSERGRRLASRLESGMVFLNSSVLTAPELPFGGIKRSGYGRELSRFGIEEFVNKKTVCAVDVAKLERARR